ncbi:hypothetical protein FRC11_000517, partial [Ceratobasidium sp. 423]
MKISSPANIALASIALSSPNLLSSPVFANAAPTGNSGSLSPNLGAGYFGTSPQMHATDSPVMPTMTTPPTSKIAGRRRSLRRSKAIKHRNGEKASRNIDPLGLGVSAGDIQSGAESILHSRMAPTGSFSGAQGTIDPFSPIVGPGGLLTSTGLVPPNTPMLGGVPLSNGVDPSMLLGAIPAMVPTPGVDNVIPIIQNTVSGGTPGALLSPLTTGSLPYLNGLSPILGAAPIPLPQVPGAIPPLAGGLSSAQGVSSQVPGVPSRLPNTVPQVPGVSQALPVAVPDMNRLAPPAIVPNLGAVPNVAMPPLSGALPQVPGLAAGAPQLASGMLQVPDAVSQIPGMAPQVPGGTSAVPQVPGIVPQLPVDPSRKVNPGPSPSPAGAAPVSVGSEIPLASPVVPVGGLAVPAGSLAAPTSMVPLSSVALPTPASGLNALPTSMSDLNVPPMVTATSRLARPIESLAPPDPLSASNSLPHILVSGPDGVGMFEPLEGIGAGGMGRPDDDGAQTESTRPEKGHGVRPMESGEFGGSGIPDKDAQAISGTKSAVESRATSWSTTQSERAMADRTTSELAPTNLARPSVKLDVPTTTAFFTSRPTVTDAQITFSPEPTLKVDEETRSVWKRSESKSPSLPNDIGSAGTDESGSPLLSEGVAIPTSSVYLPSATRLRVSSQDSLSVS